MVTLSHVRFLPRELGADVGTIGRAGRREREPVSHICEMATLVGSRTYTVLRDEMCARDAAAFSSLGMGRERESEREEMRSSSPL